MPGLNDYMQQVQRMMRDQNQKTFNPGDLAAYINRSRRQIALQSQSIRCSPPIAGQVVTGTVVQGGSGYTNPLVVISSPDYPNGAKLYPLGAQAVGTASVDGSGAISDVQIVFGGDGYFQPTIEITDPTGTGAVITAQTSPINITQNGQEIYNFSDVPLANFPGVDGVYNVRSVSVIFSNWQYSCLRFPFLQYQGYIRRYPRNYLYVPEVVAQYGQGKSGSLYGYPIANAQYQWTWDCICSPQDLITPDSVEALPEPWTDAVPFLAAYYCYLEIANLNGARFFKSEFDDFMHRYSAGARPGGVPVNMYGRS